MFELVMSYVIAALLIFPFVMWGFIIIEGLIKLPQKLREHRNVNR